MSPNPVPPVANRREVLANSLKALANILKMHARFPLLLQAVLLVFAAIGLPACDYTDATVPTYQKGYKPIQPISFSHKLHAGEMGMDCKYCHFGAAESRNGSVPPVNVCMNCHKTVKTDSPQIKKIAEAYEKGTSINWVKVHNLPDFVNFNHSRHVGRGVACQTCHGPVETMPEVYQFSSLAMGWCVNCHRQYSEKDSAQFGQTPPPAFKDQHLKPSTDCAACHH